MQSSPLFPFAAFIGIDWADEQHAVAVCLAGSERCEVTTLDQNSQSLDAWAASLRTRFDGRPIAICLEQSRGGLVYALMRFEFLVLFPINPKQLARYREAVTPSGAKDDPGDAVLLADFVRQHHTQMRPWRPDDALTRSLKLLSEARRQRVDARTSLGQRLRQQLKEFFPLALELLDGQPIHSPWFLRLLLRFSTFAALRRASPRQIERLAPQRRRQVSSDDAPQQHPWIRLIRAARPLVTDEAVTLAGRLEVETLVPQIEVLNEAVARYDAELAESLSRHPDAALFRSVPGAGNSLTPRLIGAFGTDRERFESAAAVQDYSGIAPVTKRSGRTCTVRRRRACSKFLRQTFHELADHSRLSSRWAEAYYRMLRARDKRHHACLRALAFKWIRILFRCWRDRVPYNEADYIQRLMQTRSPILAYMPEKE
jgi:transposase